MDRGRLRSVIVLLLAGLLFAACSSGSTGTHRLATVSGSPNSASSSSMATQTPDPPSSTQPPSPVVTTTAVEETINRAWVDYWKVSLALTKYPRDQWPTQVKAVAIDPIYGQLLNSIRVQQDKLGQVGYGYVISHPYWPSPPAPSSTTVVMGDCFDGSHAGTRAAKSGQVKTVGKAHTDIHATLVKGQDGLWRVHQIEYLKASC